MTDDDPLRERMRLALLDAPQCAHHAALKFERPDYCGDCASNQLDAVLATLAASTSEEVLEAAVDEIMRRIGFTGADAQRLVVREQLMDDLRAVVPILLAGERAENESLRSDMVALDAMVATLRQRLAVVELERDTAINMLRQAIHKKSLMVPSVYRPIEAYLAALAPAPAGGGELTGHAFHPERPGSILCAQCGGVETSHEPAPAPTTEGKP